jgi:hypothetical protein
MFVTRGGRVGRRAFLLLSVSGADAAEVVRGLRRLGLTPGGRDLYLEVNYEKREATDDWLDRWLGEARVIKAVSNEGQSLTFERGGLVTLGRPDTGLAAPETFEQLGSLPFEVAVIGRVYPEWWDEQYETYSFSDGHIAHGWACAFRGAGYERLVSRRWLDFGPWRKREVGDATWIEFHDIDADPGTALEQAQPGWRRMGVSDAGGFIQSGFVYTEDVSGVYDPTARKLKVMVPSGEVSQRKMLEIAAVRRNALAQAERPIERTAFVFLDEANARRHLHELWLREHECRAIADGVEHRLDDVYQPQPSPPAWSGG